MPTIPRHISNETPSFFPPLVALGVFAVPLDPDAAVTFPVEGDVAEPREVADPEEAAGEVAEPEEVAGEVAEPGEVVAEPVEAVVFGKLRLVPVPLLMPVAMKVSVLVGVPVGKRLFPHSCSCKLCTSFKSDGGHSAVKQVTTSS